MRNKKQIKTILGIADATNSEGLFKVFFKGIDTVEKAEEFMREVSDEM